VGRQEGYGAEEDLEYIEERGRMPGAVPSSVSELAKKRQREEMGTLGSGNHYLEVQTVERIYDEQAARAFGLARGQVVVSIHCGSRGLGHQIGTDYLVSLAKAAKRLGLELPERELACAPINSAEGQAYLGAMNAAINVALANRQILTHLTRRVLGHFFPQARIETLFDVSHNTCKPEWHEFGGKRRLLYVHRKGATRAFGPGHSGLPERYRAAGQPVIIGAAWARAPTCSWAPANQKIVRFLRQAMAPGPTFVGRRASGGARTNGRTRARGVSSVPNLCAAPGEARVSRTSMPWRRPRARGTSRRRVFCLGLRQKIYGQGETQCKLHCKSPCAAWNIPTCLISIFAEGWRNSTGSIRS
jgi:hypothetical protein